jgi:hypothetical protein
VLTLFRVTSIAMLIWLVAGCTSQPQPPAQPQVSPFASVLSSPTSAPTAPPPTILPKPSAGKGSIVGTLLVEGQEIPMAGTDVFLGQLLGATEDSQSPVFGMDLKTAPHVVTDQWGGFVFTDVLPGSYAVILWNPISSTMAKSADGQVLKVTVESQQIENLGVLREPALGR